MDLRRRRTMTAVVVASGALVSACSPSPAGPDEGELTGVVVSVNDHPMFPPGDSLVDSYRTLVLLTPADFVRRWEEAHPDFDDDSRGPITPDHWMAGSAGFRLPADEVSEGTDPRHGPVMTPIVDGRWRIPWEGGPAMVCLANRGHSWEDDTDHVNIEGCALLDQEPPVAVTMRVGLGGIGMVAES